MRTIWQRFFATGSRLLPLVWMALAATSPALGHIPKGSRAGRSFFQIQVALNDRKTNVWNFYFDGANRLTNTTSPTGRHYAQFRNNRGLLSLTVLPSGNTSAFLYDAKGRITNRADAVGTNAIQYDADNNVAKLTENGATFWKVYDAYDRLVSFTNGEGFVFQYQYDANGNLVNLVYPGGKTVAYGYDSLNRLTNVTDWASRSSSYTYDLAGHMTSMTRPNGTKRVISYDAAGEITSILEETSGGKGVNYFQYTNDLAGRMQSEFIAPVPHAFTASTRNMTFDADDRLTNFAGTSVTMDADGNMTYGPGTNVTFASYTYDARNRLLTNGVASYGYDAMGSRNWVTNGSTTAHFLFNPNSRLPQALVRVKNGATNYYVYGLGLIYHADDAGNSWYCHYDSRGSTVAITDKNQNITDRIEYTPYATISFRSGTTDTPFLFNGRYGVMTDPNGLLYMRARYYNPYLCRFINADPSGFGGGLNWYAYGNGNPVSLIDPYGLGAAGDSDNSSWLINPNANVIQGQPCIVCHGVSVFGFNGNVYSFYGLTAIPGSGIDARMGYVSLIELSEDAAPFLAGPVGGILAESFDLAIATTLAAEAAEDGQMLFRGVPGNGTPKAILGEQGIAIPRGTALDEASLTQHVLGEDVNAGVTSWTTERGVAARFSGPDGTIIEVPLSDVSSQIVPRPPVLKYGSENEVLLKGTIQGTPTKP